MNAGPGEYISKEEVRGVDVKLMQVDDTHLTGYAKVWIRHPLDPSRLIEVTKRCRALRGSDGQSMWECNDQKEHRRER